MRDFEEDDFDFDFEEGIRAARIKDCRIDVNAPVIFDPNRDNDDEHQACIAIHTDRVQRELRE